MNSLNLRRLTVILLFCIGLPAFSNAQNSLESYIARYDSLKPFLNTGILLDRSPLTVWAANADFNPLYFQPNLDSVCDDIMFRNMYRLFYHADYDKTVFTFDPDSLDYHYNMAYYGQNPDVLTTTQLMNLEPQVDVVLGVASLDYEMISAAAWDSSLIYMDTSIDKFKLLLGDIHISDTIVMDTTYFDEDLQDWVVVDSVIIIDSVYRRISGGSSLAFNPYSLALLVNMSNSVCLESLQESVKFIIPQRFFFYPNSTVLKAKTLINFDDGNGFVEVAPDVVVSVNYSSFGEKTIRFMFADSNGVPMADVPARSFLTIDHCKLGVKPDFTMNPAGHNPCTVPDGGFGEGSLVAHVKLGNHGQGKLFKPFILVEGFETGRYKPGYPEIDRGDHWGFGDLNWRSFSSGNFGSVAPQLAMFPEFADTLLKLGYDLIIVDFESNRAKVQKNANALINLIQLVNDSLVENQSPHQLKVLGASMGGLIVRYALRKMELSGCCHNADTYITFSSPHRGANIPYSVQQLVYELGHGLDLFGSGKSAKGKFDHVLNSPAARQMLVYHIGQGAGAERSAFQSELDSMGHPENCRRLALTNGSDIGIGQKVNNNDLLSADFIPGDPFIELKMKLFAPVTVPGVVLPLLSLGELVFVGAGGDPNSNGILTIMQAKAHVAPNSAGSASGAIALERGESAIENFADYTQQWVTYGLGMKVLFGTQLAHKIASGISLATSFCSFCPPIEISSTVASIAIGASFTGVLVDNIIHNHQLNNVNNASFGTYFNFPTLPYDNAPGDFNNTIQDINDQSGKMATLIYPHHNFISTVSALDIETANSFANIRADVRGNVTSIPFEDYWANDFGDGQSQNQRHVRITASNINWIVKKLTETQKKFTLNSNNTLNQAFNFAQEPQPIGTTVLPTDIFLNSTNVVAGGSLLVNKYGPLGFGGPNANGSAEFSNFVLNSSWSDCDSPHVIIENEGLFMVGDTNYVNSGGGIRNNNKAEVYFRNGSILELKSGSLLRINDNSKLVIEEGAELILHDDNSILLDGTNAILEIRGKVSMVNGAVLNPSGAGYIRFAQPLTQLNPGDYWSFGGANQIILNGSGKTDKKAEIHGRLEFGAGLQELDIVNCKIEMYAGAGLHIKGQAEVENVVFLSPVANYDQVAVYGQANLLIKNSEFRKGNYGLIGYLTAISHPLKVENCDFRQCLTGLRINNKNLELKSSRLDSNGIGLHISNASADCEIKNSRFERNSSYGIKYEGQTNATLFLRESQLRHNQTGLFIGDYTKARLNCNQISHNSFAGIAALNCFLDMGGYAANQIVDNNIGVDMFETHLLIKGGRNNFSGGSSYLSGVLSWNTPLVLLGTDINGQSIYAFDVQFNRMPPIDQIIPVNIFNVDDQALFVHNWAPMSVFETSCPMSAGTTYAEWVLALSNVGLPVITNNMSDNLPLVVADAMSNMTNDFDVNPLQDDAAVLYFGEIFADVRSKYAYIYNEYAAAEALVPMTEEEVLVMQLAIDKSLKALSNAYRYEFIAPNRAVPKAEVSEEIATIVAELDNIINNYYTQSQEQTDKWFYYTLAKAQAYRTGEYYDYALDVLATMSTEDDTQNGIKEYWECVCIAEKDYILEEINVDQYFEAISNCITSSPQLRRGVRGAGVPIPREGEIAYAKLYPNPSNGIATLWFSDNKHGYSYNVSNLNGQVILTGTVNPGEEWIQLGPEKLKQGVYFIQLNDGVNSPQLLKWVIID